MKEHTSHPDISRTHMRASDKKGVRVSVVVPAHNAAPTLSSCLEALVRQDIEEPFEIIMVDDGSTDSTAAVAANYAHRVHLLSQSQLGAAAARNAGIRAATGDIVLFTDADCEPVPGWAATLINAIREGADGAKGTYRTRQKSVTARFVQAEYESKYRRMSHKRGGKGIDFIDTYSAAYSRNCLIEVGGFNEQMLADEDQELSFRLAERGYTLRFVPNAVVYHFHAASPQAYVRKKFSIGYWKVKTVAMHPRRIVRDSHTPQSIKVQILLLAAGLASIFLARFSSLARKASALCALGFLATAAPFAARVACRDPVVALVTPFMMLLRALGLFCGTLAGARRFGAQLIRQAAYSSLKRALDLALSSIGLLIMSPFVPLIAGAIKLESRGPVIFAQLRAGRDGEPFLMYKFRTMVDGAENMREALLAELEPAEPVLKFRPDPRVTRVGRFLRRWSLDELPQLINVLRGEMTLVGPRPEELAVVKAYSPWHRQRLGATPGVTGPMQVNGRANLSLDERVRFELDYVSNASTWEDVKIIAQTLRAVLSGEGAY